MLAKESMALRGRELASHEAHFIPFTAQTRMSGVDFDGREIRKGAADAIAEYLDRMATAFPTKCEATVERSRVQAERRWSSPRIERALGVIHLKDIVKGGMRERFASCGRWVSRP